MTLVIGDDVRVAGWVGENLSIQMSPPYVAIGYSERGELRAGVVLNNWNGFNFDISLYGPGHIRRGALRAVYRYAFVQAMALRLTAITKPSNEHMIKLLPKFGFAQEGPPNRRYFGNEDALRFVLFREDAERWMK